MKAYLLLLGAACFCWGQSAELTPAWNLRNALDDLVSQS
jgi:hypothetical protein